MTEFNQNIKTLTMENQYFRKEIITNKKSQLVLMSLKAGEDIGEEVHDVDQILVFVSGTGEAVLDGKKSKVAADSLVIVPAGTKHNFINTGADALKLYTVYAPPEEAPGTLHKTRDEAMAAEAEHHKK